MTMTPFLKDGRLAEVTFGNATPALPPFALFICTGCGRCQFVSLHIRFGKISSRPIDELSEEEKKELGRI